MDYGDEEVRLSVSWKAKIYADESIRQAAERGEGGLDLEEVVTRLSEALGEPLPENVETALASVDFRNHLAARWSGYRSG